MAGLLIVLLSTACPGTGVKGPKLEDLDVVAPDIPFAEYQPPEDAAIPEGAVCIPGTRQCVGDNLLQCRADGGVWEVIAFCEKTKGETCTLDGCKTKLCQPGIPECDQTGAVVSCLPDGSGFGPPVACKDGEVCIGGQCLSKGCSVGATKCTQTSLLICGGDPPAWKETPCGEKEICFKDQCVDCFADTHCPEKMICVDGRCVSKPLAIVTDTLPDGIVGESYLVELKGEGFEGNPSWFVVGALPEGLWLDSNLGTIGGIPKQKGEYPVTIKLQDSKGMFATRTFTLTVHDKGLAITSKSPLPNAEDGTPYEFKFEAVGGAPPYGWMIETGKVPDGLDLLATGVLKGTPDQAQGTYTFKVRVVDTGDPLGMDSKAFEMLVKIADLQITGKQMLNLWVTKVVVLPLITVVEGIPIPYSTQLEAKGGLKPYSWQESQLDQALKLLIPKAGVPKGLTLGKDGKLSGAVTSTSEVVEVKIPFINFTLKGFFFMARVTDSQSTPDSDQAVFLIPTVPVNLGL